MNGEYCSEQSCLKAICLSKAVLGCLVPQAPQSIAQVLIHSIYHTSWGVYMHTLAYLWAQIQFLLIPQVGYYQHFVSLQQVKFGATNNSPVMTKWTATHDVEYSDPVDLHTIVTSVSNTYNFIYPQIPVNSELNIVRWRFHLQNCNAI